MRFQEILVLVDTAIWSTKFFRKHLFWNIEGDSKYSDKIKKMVEMTHVEAYHFRLVDFHKNRFDLLDIPKNIPEREIGRLMALKLESIGNEKEFHELEAEVAADLLIEETQVEVDGESSNIAGTPCWIFDNVKN